MHKMIVPPVAGLIEPAAAPEYFVDTVGAIEANGNWARAQYCVAQAMPDDGSIQRIVVVKLIWPISRLRSARHTWHSALCALEDEEAPVRAPWQPRIVS